jgi:hypothetical protein
MEKIIFAWASSGGFGFLRKSCIVLIAEKSPKLRSSRKLQLEASPKPLNIQSILPKLEIKFSDGPKKKANGDFHQHNGHIFTAFIHENHSPTHTHCRVIMLRKIFSLLKLRFSNIKKHKALSHTRECERKTRTKSL